MNGTPVSVSDSFTESIEPGGMALVCGNSGAGGINTWTAGNVDTYAVTAQVDPENFTDECVETNNTLSGVW